MLLTALLLPLLATDSHPARDLVETAQSAGSFQTLATALGAADLVETLQGPGPFTVFAPTDAAFAALPQETLQALLLPENKGALTSVLTLHVVSGDVSAKEAIASATASALSGEKLSFAIEAGQLRVNDASVVQNDIAASNGTIHAIDQVLLPADGLKLAPRGRLVIGIYNELPSRALASQLGLDRNKAQLLTEIVEGSEAEKAGLQIYDVVVSIDGLAATEENLRRAKADAGFGGTLELELVRAGKRRTIHVGVGLDEH